MIVLGEPAVSGAGMAPAIPFVQAVGNDSGGNCNVFRTVPSPATAKNSITVGSLVPGTNSLSGFSSRGPTDDGRIRPDLVATGGHTSTLPGDGYGFKTGTSMASPVVTGIAALLIEEWRWLYTLDQPLTQPLPPHKVKAILIHTATDLGLPGPDYSFGWGRVNAREAVDLARANYVAS